MVGITSYGAYIPLYRIQRMTIYQALGWLNPASLLPGEKAVANYDEDSLTMAVAASVDCLNGLERDKVDRPVLCHYHRTLQREAECWHNRYGARPSSRG